MIQRIITATLAIIGISKCYAFTNNIASSTSRTNSHQQQHHRTSPLQLSETSTTPPGNLHGQSACFLPILQNDDEYIAPRIVQVRVPTYIFVNYYLLLLYEGMYM